MPDRENSHSTYLTCIRRMDGSVNLVEIKPGLFQKNNTNNKKNKASSWMKNKTLLLFFSKINILVWSY